MLHITIFAIRRGDLVGNPMKQKELMQLIVPNDCQVMKAIGNSGAISHRLTYFLKLCELGSDSSAVCQVKTI